MILMRIVERRDPLHYALMVLEINDTKILDPRIPRGDPSAVAHEGRSSA